MKTYFRWLAVLMVLIAQLPEGVSAQAPNPPKPSGEIAPVQLPAEETDEATFGELPKGGSPMGPPWTVQRIDNRHFFSQQAAAKHYLKIDSTGTPHIVYGGDHLYHTWWNLGYWHTEVVDASINVGSFASLAIDSTNFLHIAYYDAGNQDLKYATNAFGGWYVTTIASTGDVGAGTDIGVDVYQDPYFVYRDSTNGHLMFATLTNGTMEEPPEIISGTIYPAGMFAMAAHNPLDVHVIFYSIYDGGSELEGELYYTSTRTTTRWQPHLIESGDVKTGQVADLALDSASNPHVVFGYDGFEYTMSRYFFSTNFGSNWTYLGEFVDGYDLPDGLALALNSSNLPTVAMQVGGILYKYTWSGTAWSSVPVDPGTSTGFYPAIALYPSTSTNFGNPAFAYLDDPAGKNIHLNYREIYAGNWWPADGPALVDQSQKVGACSTSLTGPDGNPWVVYSGEPTQKLYFKRFYNGAWTAAQEIGSEYTGTINCFHAASMGGEKAGVLFSTTDQQLLYTTISCSGSNCIIPSPIVIESSWDSPVNFIDLVMDNAGNPHALYLGSSSPQGRALIYWYYDGIPVTRFGPTIQDWSQSYRPVSMKRTSGGVLHIVYQKYAVYDELYYLQYYRGSFLTPELLSSDEVYRGVSLGLDMNSQPGAAFITSKSSPGSLSLLQRSCIGSICNWGAPLVIDSSTDLSAYILPSLTIDSLGRYRLSYVQASGGMHYLQYVQINGTQKEFRNVYLYPGLGSMSSLALSPTGVGRISFNDATNGDLMFAWQNVELFLPMIRR